VILSRPKRPVLEMLEARVLLDGGAWGDFDISPNAGPDAFAAEPADILAVVTIPDGGLEQAVRDELGIPSAPLTGTDMLLLTFLDGTNRGISDLTGIEHAEDLRALYLGQNRITDVLPVAGLVHLEELDLSDNRINDISPLVGLANLGDFWLNGNYLYLGPGSTAMEAIDAFEDQGAVVDYSPQREPGDELAMAYSTGSFGDDGTTRVSAQTIGDGPYAAADVDLYRITLVRSGPLLADVDAQSIQSGLDAYLRLFSADGVEIASNNDRDGLDPYLSPILSAGTYYVGVSGNPNGAYSPATGHGALAGATVGEYVLRITAEPTVLTWDGTDSADWTSAHWNPGPMTPNGGEAMVVDSGVVDVSADLTAIPAVLLDIAGGAAGGTVNIAEAGELSVAAEVNVGVGGTLSVGGVLTAGAVNVTGGSLTNSRGGTAAVTVVGDVVLAGGGTLVVDLMDAGTDTLVVSGVVELGPDALLEIVMDGGGREFRNGTYTLIQAAGGLTGTFAHVTGLGAYVAVDGNGLTYDAAAGTVTLTLVKNLNPGDGNLDGRTDVSDRIIWNNNNFTFGTTFKTGDWNNDGKTDVSDRIIWNNSNFTFATSPWDYGDAPSSYPTLHADDGARHLVTGPRLGANRDHDHDGLPTASADGDDTAHTPDDEDGVIVPVLAASPLSTTPAGLTVDLQNADPSANRLDAWIDFNQDGDWDDAGEQIFTSYDLGTSDGTQTLSFTVPRDTGGNIVAGTTFARFRVSTAGGLSTTGLADDGEVEDHLVAVTWFSPPGALVDNPGTDHRPQVTADGVGNWVAVWRSDDSLGGTIGTDMDILLSRSADAGGTWTAPAPLNTNAASDSGHDYFPQVTTDGVGNWVAVWRSSDSLGETIGTDYDILVSRSTDAGTTWTAPAPLNTNADSDAGSDWYPQVTTDRAGNWVAVWHSSDSLGQTIDTDGDILVSRSSDAGVTWTAPAPLNTNAGSDSGNDQNPQVTTDGAGNWVAVWFSEDSLGQTIGTDRDILVSRSADAGVTWTDPAPLNANAASDSRRDWYPQVTTDGQANWVAVWESSDSLDGTIGTDGDILVSRSTDAGGTWTAPAPLNTNAGSDSGGDNRPQVKTDGAGNWIAVWDSFDSLGGTIGTDRDILMSRSADAGETWTGPLPLNANAGPGSGNDKFPQAASDGAGNWVVVWESDDSLGETTGTDTDILFATFSEVLWDYGDAPSPYLTMLADVGARHVATGPMLGTNRDAERDAQPTADADGDDTTGAPDDEDGVVFTSALAAGHPATVEVTASGPGFLSAWIDFNLDGDWADADEQIFSDEALVAGVNSLAFQVPTASPDVTYTRFRFSTVGGLSVNGPALDGEVEDHPVTITWFSPPSVLTDNSVSDARPQITTDGAGNWIAVWDSEDTLGETIGTDRDILISRSTDAGRKWTAPVPLNTNAPSDSGDDNTPQITTDGAGNWVAVWESYDSLGLTIGTDRDILVSRSTDAGVTWTAPVPLNTNADSDSGADGSAQVTTDGAGNWIAAWDSRDSFGATIDTDGDILVSRSTDAGVTWTAPAILNTNAGEDSRNDWYPQVATDRAGNWVAVWESYDTLGGTLGTDQDILVSRSTDAGLTWTPPAPLNTNAASDSGGDTRPQITTDGEGNWIAVWSSSDRLGGTVGTDRDILVSRSADAGDTWTAPAPLNTNANLGSASDFNPQVTTDGAGNWLAVWFSEDPLGDAIGTDRDILVSRSTDGGVTWIDPVPLNSNADLDVGADFRPELTTDGKGNWIAVWTSTDSLDGTIGTDEDVLFASFLQIPDHGNAPQVEGFGLSSTDAAWTLGTIDSAVWTAGRDMQTAPWSMIDSLVVRFNELVEAAASDLVLTGLTGGVVNPTGASGWPTDVVTWAAGADIATDRWTVAVGTGVVNLAGTALAEEWTADLNVLVGDINGDGQVSSRDRRELRTAYGSDMGGPTYTVFADLNGDGRVSSRDRRTLRSNYGKALPDSPALPGLPLDEG